VRPGETVLDLGSGAGLDLILAGQTVGPEGRVIGVDMTASMIERARANVARAGLANVEIREGLIEKLPVEDASVDWVISNCVISLSPEKARVFSEIARVLRPGGQMLISDIVVDDRLAWVLRRLTRIAPSIAMARTERVYLAAMAEAGLVDVTVEDRLVYEVDDLVGLFGDGVTKEAAAACPVGAIGDRVKHSSLGRGVVRLAARTAAGHVWSSKFRAHRA
jgi:SAM-dependent methyltransferase